MLDKDGHVLISAVCRKHNSESQFFLLLLSQLQSFYFVSKVFVSVVMFPLPCPSYLREVLDRKQMTGDVLSLVGRENRFTDDF